MEVGVSGKIAMKRRHRIAQGFWVRQPINPPWRGGRMCVSTTPLLQCPSLRLPGFEDSLPDVASRSFRRRGEVGRTKRLTRQRRSTRENFEATVEIAVY
jgi:hypothetical protein